MHIQAASGQQATVFHAGQTVGALVRLRWRLKQHEQGLQGSGACFD